MFISLNGKNYPANEPVLLADNRGYRYGDGLFETMKMSKGSILLSELHFERLFYGLKLLELELPNFFTPEKLRQEIIHLAEKNHCQSLARIRFSVFRGNGGLYDGDKILSYLIECWPLNESHTRMNENGLIIDIFTGARKSCDQFAALKSANFLPYTMAAQYAKANKLNDCLVVNTNGAIADSTIANLFVIKDNVISTPALTEGCVNGVMRRYLLSVLPAKGYVIMETAISKEMLENADEIFLTNAINGIRWVRQFRDKNYSNKLTVEIYNRFVKTIPL